MSVCTTLAAAGLFAAAGPIPAPLPVAPPPRAVGQHTQVFQLRNVAAADVARALAQYAPEAGRVVVVAAEPRSNVVLVRATAPAQARVAEVVAAADAPPVQHLLSVMVAEVPRSFLTDCGLRTAADRVPVFTLTEREHRMLTVAFRDARDRTVLSRPQVQVIDNQTGFVQVGQEFPVVHAAGTRQEVVYLPTGITMRVTPRTLPGGATQLRAEVQHSMPGPAVVTPTASGALSCITSMHTTWVQPAGATSVIAVPATNGAGKEIDVLIFVTPTSVNDR